MGILVAISQALGGREAFGQPDGGFRRSRTGRRFEVLAAVVARTTPAVAAAATVTTAVPAITAPIATGSIAATAIPTSAFAAIFARSTAPFLRGAGIFGTGFAGTRTAPTVVTAAVVTAAIRTTPVSPSGGGRAIVIAGSTAVSTASSGLARLHVAIDDSANGLGPGRDILFASGILSGVIAEIDEIVTIVNDRSRFAGGTWSILAAAFAVFRFLSAWFSFASRLVTIATRLAAAATLAIAPYAIAPSTASASAAVARFGRAPSGRCAARCCLFDCLVSEIVGSPFGCCFSSGTPRLSLLETLVAARTSRGCRRGVVAIVVVEIRAIGTGPFRSWLSRFIASTASAPAASAASSARFRIAVGRDIISAERA